MAAPELLETIVTVRPVSAAGEDQARDDDLRARLAG